MELGTLGKGLLHAVMSTNAKSPWSKRYKRKDYYKLVGLPMRQFNEARDILEGNYYMLVSLPMRLVNGVRDIRKWIITC